MKASSHLITFIKKTEACKLAAYPDAAGVWTIGYGHTGDDVHPADRITQAEAEKLLWGDLERFEAAARKVKGITTQGQFDAVVDFMYNCGIGNFSTSTLKKYIESRRRTWEIQEQFLRWVHSGGRKLGGLVTRRIWEANRWAE